MAKRGASERYALDDGQISRLWGVCKTLDDKVLVGL
ncbi:unnamed protein product, partial [marine sediment metagenome]